MSRGRPMAFEPELALEKAMYTFWLKGYEATSIEDLTMAMEIKRPSLYRTFGDKEALFLKTVDRYIETMGEAPRRALEEADDIRQAIEHFFLAAIANVTTPNQPTGCLVACVLAAAAPLNERFAEKIKECFKQTDQMICDRLDRAVADRQLPKNTDTQLLAQLINSFRHGFAVRARSGTQAETLSLQARSVTQTLIPWQSNGDC
ncbi:MAG: TetR/AcrR family transcriptional regulator [Phormidesmis sp.]